MALVSLWYSKFSVGNSLTNHSGPHVLCVQGAKEGVNTSQVIKTWNASGKRTGLV